MDEILNLIESVSEGFPSYFFCQPSSKWVTFSNQGKIMQQKERDVFCLYFAVPMVQWDSNPTAPTAIRLWETFTLTLRWGLFGVFFLLLMISLVPSISLWEEARCRLL